MISDLDLKLFAKSELQTSHWWSRFMILDIIIKLNNYIKARISVIYINIVQKRICTADPFETKTSLSSYVA